MNERAGLVEVAAKAILRTGGVEALGGGGIVEEGGAEDDDATSGRFIVVCFADAAGVAGLSATFGVAVDVYVLGVAGWVPGCFYISVHF